MEIWCGNYYCHGLATVRFHFYRVEKGTITRYTCWEHLSDDVNAPLKEAGVVTLTYLAIPGRDEWHATPS